MQVRLLADTHKRFTAEAMHAIIAHQRDVRCLTLEAGSVKVADALDMTQGRSASLSRPGG